MLQDSQDSQDSSDEKHLMDNLLESLRDGRDIDSRSRRKRGEREKCIERSMSIALKAESILNRLKNLKECLKSNLPDVFYL